MSLTLDQINTIGAAASIVFIFLLNYMIEQEAAHHE